MKTLRTVILAIMGIFSIACAPKDLPEPEPELKPEPVTTDLWNTVFTPESFHQSSYHSNSLELTSRDSDGLMIFSSGTEYTSVDYRYSAPRVTISPRKHAVTTDVVPGGRYETHFHFELPMTAEASIPKEFLEIASFRMDGTGGGLSVTLAHDFPFAKARIENATITFPDWVDSSNRICKWSDGNLLPGKQTHFGYRSEEVRTMQEAKASLTEDHRLSMDATMVIDGTIRVEEADRKDAAEAASPWSATLLVDWEETESLLCLTGKMDLDKTFKDQALTYVDIPSFMGWKGLVFDLEDVHAEVRVLNGMEAPVSVSGVLMGDEREYPFGAENGRTPARVPAGKDVFHILFSEKGRGGEMKNSYGEPYTDRIDLPTPGFSGLIDADPVSFALKSIQVKTDPEQDIPFHFDRDNRISVLARISSKMMVGKDFQFQAGPMLLGWIPKSKTSVSKIEGSFQVSNSLPFDFEITPLFDDFDGHVMPVRLETIRIPAGERGKPTVVPVDFKWESGEPVAIRSLGLNLSARTGEGREGESLYKDQQFTVGEVSFLAY
jgi:hypothetical protein